MRGTDRPRTVVSDEICKPEETYDSGVDEDDDAIRIPLMEEQLLATVRPAETGPVRIVKRLISEGQIVEVPVTEEEIRVERRIVDRPVDAADPSAGVASFEQIIIEIPLRGEPADIAQQARMTEEIVVSKEVVSRTQRVTVPVRREEVHIDERVPDSSPSREPSGHGK
jgi:stress response protein YsnF